MLREVKWLSSESLILYQTKPGFQWIYAAPKASALSSTAFVVQNACFLSQWGPLSLFSTAEVANILSLGLLKRETLNLWVFWLYPLLKNRQYLFPPTKSVFCGERITFWSNLRNKNCPKYPSKRWSFPYWWCCLAIISFSPFSFFVNILFLKHLLLLGAPESRFPVWGLDSQKAKLISILHLAYLMPEEAWGLWREPGETGPL